MNVRINCENERIKRRFLQFMKQAKRFSEDTIRAHERALEFWERYTSSRDFRRITAKSAGDFCTWLANPDKCGRDLSAPGQYQTVRLVRSFFLWLVTQPGRNSKSISVALGYLSVDRETVAEATSPGRRRVPTLEYVKRLANSIDVKDEVDRRDRALVAFMLLYGTRASAAATLPIGCFNELTLVINQDPRFGVKTKNRKVIRTKPAMFDKQLMSYVLEWVTYLRKQKLYGDDSPLFPRTKVGQVEGTISYDKLGVEPVFWKSGARVDAIIKERATQADLEPYDSHSFRHAHIHIALSRARTGEEQKAISQNLGHSHFATTAFNYGHLEDEKVEEIVAQIDFEAEPNDQLSVSEIKRLKQMLNIPDLTSDVT